MPITQHIHMVDLVGQYQKIKPEVDAAIADILSSGGFIGGKYVELFKSNLSTYLDAHVIPCANGTDALQIALMALDLKPGDEVITTPFTFIATAEVIALLGLKPVFVDIDPKTYNISPACIEAAITEKTKCILPVHLYGQGADMEVIMTLAKRHDLYVIEDNAQAIGADFFWSDGRDAQELGTIGHIGTTSFYPSKNLGAYGDAGAIFTKDDELANRLKQIANHGQLNKYYSEIIGVNSRLDAIQAAVLYIKLGRLEDYIDARRAAARFYDEAFANCDRVVRPHRAKYSSHVFHQYTLRLLDADRDEVRDQLKAAGIPSMIYYPQPLHLSPAFANLNYKKGQLPEAEGAAKSVISLPMHSELDEAQLSYISKTFLKILEQNS